MHSRLSQHLHTNNILVTEQHGFRKGIATENATFRLPDSVFTSINHKMHVGGIFCDLAKAFDCANHEILLAKLHFYGIQGVTADRFKSYLTNRKQKVEIKSCNATQNVFSDSGTLKHGVPQRSILGPSLFLIYRHTQKNGEVLIVNTIKTAPFFCACPVYKRPSSESKYHIKINNFC
jgi:hypothetical protein